MLGEALRAPLRDRAARDACAVCVGLVLAVLLLVRAGRALWPDAVAVVPAALVVVPGATLAGYLGDVLRTSPDDGGTPPFRWSRDTLRVGLRALAVGGVLLVPAAAAVLGTAFVVVRGTAGPLLTVAATAALLATVASVYLLPAAVATAVEHGVRAGLRRSAVGGLASGSYFFAWTVAASLVVVAWSALAAVGPGTLAGVLGAVVVAYAHVVAARLLADGLARSRWAA
jgi:hypothetical protein